MSGVLGGVWVVFGCDDVFLVVLVFGEGVGFGEDLGFGEGVVLGVLVLGVVMLFWCRVR